MMIPSIVDKLPLVIEQCEGEMWTFPPCLGVLR